MSKKPRTVSSRKLTIMRQATTRATQRIGIGGVEKRAAHKPKPVTLAGTEKKT